MTAQVMRNRLRDRREEQGLSAVDLAALAGVSRITIGWIEREQQVPSGTVQLKLAEALGTTVQDLFWSEPADQQPEPLQAAAVS